MATPYDTTQEGFEAQLGTNHIGHALLTKLLLPLLVSTSELPDSDVRIVSVSSIGHNMAPRGGILFDQEAVKRLTPAQLYGQSKLANILHIQALARRYPKITSTAVHPGVIKTDLYGPVQKAIWLVRIAIQTVGSFVFSDVKFGAQNQLWAATARRDLVGNGQYYMPVGKAIGASRYVGDVDLSNRLWVWTEEQFKSHGILDPKKDT
jgi:NAD(P)-dependent dehydrogenase (short-subunit alcohol dehydrogenase family)